MEVSQLRALLLLKESASLTKSAKHLGLSTSAVFCQIHQLEEEVGKKVYHQIGKKLRLTDTGDLLSQYADRLVQMHDTAVSSVREQGNLKRRMVRIGCAPHTSVKIVPHLVGALLAFRPNTEVRISTSGDQALLRDLRLGMLDAVLMSLPAGDTELIEEPLWSYEMVLVMPPIHWKGQRGADNFNANHLPFILFRRAGLSDFEFRQVCQDLGLEPNVVIENDELDSIKQLVKLGLGITVLPAWSVIEEQLKRRLTITRLKSRFFHNYGVLCRRSGYRPKALDDLLAVARKWRDWWPLASNVSDPIYEDHRF